jgi:hypothetical protein
MFNEFLKFLKTNEDEKEENIKLRNKVQQTKDENFSYSFYESYFKTYDRIKTSNSLFSKFINQSDKNQKDPNNNYFGAFLNISNTNEKEKLGIPMIFKNRDENGNLQNEKLNYIFNSQEEPSNLIYKKEEELISVNKNESMYDLSSIEHSLNSYNLSHLRKSPHTVQIEQLPATRESSYNAYFLEECLILNPLKVVNYEIKLRKSFENIIYDIGNPIDSKSIFLMIIYLIQGIPSQLFYFDNLELTFKLSSNNIRFISTLHQVCVNFITFFLDFGKKMFLIQLITEHFLYNTQQCPYVVKNFYSSVNSIMIKINEIILNYKDLLINSKINLIQLHVRLEQELVPLINTFYGILNIEPAISNYFKINENISQNERNLNNFLKIYEENNFKISSHKLMNALFNFHSSNYIRDNNYYILRNILIIGIKSYLLFIFNLVFRNEIIDQQHEYFIIYQENSKIIINNEKVPEFLIEYKNIILNNSIILNLIKKFDSELYNCCSFKVKEFIQFLENFSFDYKIIEENIQKFNEMKKHIFNRKFIMMFKISESLLNERKQNEVHETMKRLERIRINKEVF